MTHWFFLASHPVNLLITSVGFKVSSESYGVQTICHASSVTSQTGEKKKSSILDILQVQELPDVLWISSAHVVIKKTYMKVKESFSLSLATSNHTSEPNSLLCYAVTLLVSIESCWCQNDLKNQ